MALFTAKSLFKDVVAHLNSFNEGDLYVYDECAAAAYNEALLAISPNITFLETVNLCGVDPKLDPCWFLWLMVPRASRFWSEYDAEMQQAHVDKVLAHALNPTTSGAFAAKAFKELYDRWTPQQRTDLLNKIIDPMTAFQVYLKVADLTNAEDVILKAKFHGQLPTAEKELADGVVVRAKPTVITPGL